MQKQRPVAALTLFIAGVLLALGRSAYAAPFLETSSSSSLSYVQPCCSVFSDTGTNSSDAEHGTDFSKSFVTIPLRGFNFTNMGAAFSGGPNVHGSSQSEWQEAFFCSAGCPTLPGIPGYDGGVALTFLLNLNFTASNIADASFIELDAQYTINSRSKFTFEYFQDGASPPEARADLDGVPGTVVMTQDPSTGNWNVSISDSGLARVCDALSPCTTPAQGESCVDDSTCPTPPAFQVDQSIALLVDDGNSGQFLDAFDPFAAQFISNDPKFQFSASNDFASTSLPEPDSASMLGVALMLLCVASRWSPRAPASYVAADCRTALRRQLKEDNVSLA